MILILKHPLTIIASEYFKDDSVKENVSLKTA